jgi:CBS domain-containing protein
LGSYGAGCDVWVAYGIGNGSAPLVVSQSVALVGSATATVLALRFRRFDGDRWQLPRALRPRPRRGEERSTPAPRIGDVMVPAPPAVLDELVVVEARRAHFRGPASSEPSVIPVVDRYGRAVGILTRADLAALRPADRASRLVAELADHDPAVIASMELDAGAVLARPAVVRAGLVLVTVTDRRRLVGVAFGVPSTAAQHSVGESFGLRGARRGRSRRRDAPWRPVAGWGRHPQ